MDSRQDSVSEQEWVIEFHRLRLILALLYAVCSVATYSLSFHAVLTAVVSNT